MKKKKKIGLIAGAVLATLLGVYIVSLYYFDESKADKSLPNFLTAGKGAENADKDGWYEVFTDEFLGTELNSDIWTTSPHGLRKETNVQGDDIGYNSSYWCPSMVKVSDGMVEIRAEQQDNHVCVDGICPLTGRFTGGIETRKIAYSSQDEDITKGKSDDLLFAQAFGYFEARVKFPDGPGAWSAFWLQSSNQRKLGNRGKDGTEIDVYESAFQKNPSVMGHALLWDGYGLPRSGVKGKPVDTGANLYGGFHTFGVKWTPDYYVFYIDGIATWTTNAGGVSKVKQFLRLTVELDEGDAWGPHGQQIGTFDPDNEYVFYVDYVKVYQNVKYAKYEKDDSYYKGSFSYVN
ncbi:MAG: glycoside hydrolase family 16 protein [Clostridiales bacterium]|jgi:hypothetical protein|nr:glycoside hydrolase family 16 protein [Clostridiales bacterium]